MALQPLADRGGLARLMLKADLGKSQILDLGKLSFNLRVRGQYVARSHLARGLNETRPLALPPEAIDMKGHPLNCVRAAATGTDALLIPRTR